MGLDLDLRVWYRDDRVLREGELTSQERLSNKTGLKTTKLELVLVVWRWP